MVWQSTSDTPYDAAVDADGAVVVGTGPDGKIFRVEGLPRTTVLLARAAARQVTRFERGPDGQLHYTTANPGSLFRLAANRAGSGTYTSEVHDARTIATWGTIRWRADAPGGSSIRLQTRSGNTAVPSDTWSPWSGPYASSSGTAITSPNARYLQWRALLAGDGATPALFSVTAAYLPRNLPPEITRVTVHPPGQVNLRSFPHRSADRRARTPSAIPRPRRPRPERRRRRPSAARSIAGGCSPSPGRRGIRTTIRCASMSAIGRRRPPNGGC